MTPRLYISDLDGTLLDPGARLSERTRAGLLRLLAADVPFTIATARHPQSIRLILGDLPLRLPVVALHGALLTDMSTLSHIHVRAIPRDAALGVVDIAKRHGTSAWVSTTTGTADHVTYDVVTNGGMQWYLDDRTTAGDPRLRRRADLTTVFVDPVTCITVMAQEETTRAIAADVSAEHGGTMKVHVYENAYSPGWWWMTAHSAAAGKDVGVGDLLARHDFDGHEIVVFGDTTGDLPLFAAGHRRVAVENAEDAVKSAACEVIGPHDEDSVIEFLLRDAGLL